MANEIYRDQECEDRAYRAADYIFKRLGKPIFPIKPLCLVLGSGWGKSVQLENEIGIPFGHIPGLDGIPKKEGHEHMLKYGLLAGVPVFVLSGRAHMNAATMHPEALIPQKVRLQTEMLLVPPLGIETFIVTNAAGGSQKGIEVGRIIVADGFCSRYAILPLTGNEHVDPEGVLDEELAKEAMLAAHDIGLTATRGGYAMMMGPHFESRKYDKEQVARGGVAALGMSTVQEASTLALYKKEEDGPPRMVAISFISNNSTEKHSDDEIRRRIEKASPRLKPFLELLVQRVGLPRHMQLAKEP
ncbi:MAG: hypothetical protein AAB400_03535 [Patescibacteria group bacterium]